MTNKPRVLIFGVGGYGVVYLREILQNNAWAQIVGVCDTDSSIAQKQPLLTQYGIPVYRDAEAFYAENTADLAIIVSPVHYHAETAVTCLAHGSNVLCEKPLCLTLEEAGRMSKAAKAANRFLSLGYQLNYRRDVLALKRDILEGRFGAPKRLSIYHCFRRGAKYYARNNWAGRIAVNGREVFDSPFTNASAHNFQMMTFLLGEQMHTACDVTGLEAELYRGNPQVENYDIAALRFQTSVGAPLLYYTAHPLKADLGPRGVFEFERGTITFDAEAPSFHAVLHDGEQIDYTKVDPGSPMQKLHDALDCISHGGAPICGVEADLPHIHAVRMVQSQPVRPVRDALRYTMELGGDTFVCIRGLEEAFIQSARAWALPSEIGLGL